MPGGRTHARGRSRGCRTCGIVLLAVASSAGAVRAASQDSGYHLVSTIRLGGSGGPGELALDAATLRLFVPRSSRVTVVDVERGRQLGDITGTPGVHGVALAPALGRGFTSNGSANTLTAFTLQTLHASSDHPGTGASPGAIVYDPGSRRVFTMNADSNNATAIEAAGAAIAGTVPLGGRP